jgi:GNAT superfamily N-acetyltransferase
LSAPELRLRQAGLDDVGTVREILAAAAADLTACFGDGHWSTVRAIETLRKYADNGDLCLVEANSIAVGTLRLTDRKIGFYRNDWFARPDDPAGYLLDMAVHPNHQRRGIGRRSLQLTEQLARGAGLRAIRLDAYVGPAGAGDFYKKCGYALMHAGAFKGVALEYFEKLLLPNS